MMAVMVEKEVEVVVFHLDMLTYHLLQKSSPLVNNKRFQWVPQHLDRVKIDLLFYFKHV